MRPIGIDEYEQLRYARERARELRHDWQVANATAPDSGKHAGLIASARLGAGRTLIGLGTMLLPRREPCA